MKSTLLPNLRDSLYNGLPTNVKTAIRSQLQSIDANSQLSRSKQKWRRLFSGLFHLPQIQPKHIKVLVGLENGQTKALSPDENMPAASFPLGSGGNENMPVLSSPPFSSPATATNKNSQLGPNLNNQGLQSPVVYQQQQGLMNNYPQQSINQNQNQNQNQPLTGFTQPFSSLNQPFLGVNYQPFDGVGNQQGLVDNNNTPFDT
ncbi:hypothetical protein QYF36_021557 [Acer negundo]|nr:hypothetical protein QYF36_021557 [Acer negundo]